MHIMEELTENFLDDLVAGTEGAVVSEMLHVFQEYVSHSQHNLL